MKSYIYNKSLDKPRQYNGEHFQWFTHICTQAKKQSEVCLCMHKVKYINTSGLSALCTKELYLFYLTIVYFNVFWLLLSV